MRRLLCSLSLLLLTVSVIPATTQAEEWHELTRPIDSSYLTGLPFGTKSHWIQPWRAYMDTPPATRLRDGIGVNFNVPRPNEAQAVAPLLRDSGIRRARMEIGWNSIAFRDETRLYNERDVRANLVALRDAGIRPLILLNANDGGPGPTRTTKVTVAAPAARGDRQIQLDSASVVSVTPRLTGLSDGFTAARIVTGIDASGLATLSQPLSGDLPAGARIDAVTLSYEPFAGPELADGRPNPRFERTLAGWLRYVGTVTRLVRDVYGDDHFDVEVWNELGFGSRFLWIGNYYDPLPEPTKGDVTQTLLARTAGFLKDPANGVPHVRIGTGFSNQRPWDSGATIPAGVDAIDHHPYHQSSQFPWQALANGNRPLDANGALDSARTAEPYPEKFTPRYNAYLPEYFLTGIQTESLIRDMAPLTTKVGGIDHGRNVVGPDGRPPATWITETGMNPLAGDFSPHGFTGGRVRARQGEGSDPHLSGLPEQGCGAGRSLRDAMGALEPRQRRVLHRRCRQRRPLPGTGVGRGDHGPSSDASHAPSPTPSLSTIPAP